MTFSPPNGKRRNNNIKITVIIVTTKKKERKTRFYTLNALKYIYYIHFILFLNLFLICQKIKIKKVFGILRKNFTII